jgi:citrate/tricarballylate utilization protein
VAAFYHFVFDWSAPYGYSSLPVLLGSIGGIGLLVGPAGLLLLKARRNRDISDEKKYEMDLVFIILIMLISFSGLLLLFLRGTPAMGTLFIVHLGLVMTLFIMIPYGKFVHGVYRFAALLKYALERKRNQVIGV